MSASQIPPRASAIEDRSPSLASDQDRIAPPEQAGTRLAWWRRLGTVLSAGRAELAAPLLVARVVPAWAAGRSRSSGATRRGRRWQAVALGGGPGRRARTALARWEDSGVRRNRLAYERDGA